MEETMETEPAGPTTSFTKNAVSDIIGPHPAANPTTHAPQGLRAVIATDEWQTQTDTQDRWRAEEAWELVGRACLLPSYQPTEPSSNHTCSWP